MGEGGSLRAVSGDGSHNLGGISDIVPGGHTGDNGEDGSSGELHLEFGGFGY